MSNNTDQLQELRERVRDAGEELHSYLIHYAIERNPHRDHPALKYKYEADIADADAVYMQYVDAVEALKKAESGVMLSHARWFIAQALETMLNNVDGEPRSSMYVYDLLKKAEASLDIPQEGKSNG
jgi:hypothetical protein